MTINIYTTLLCDKMSSAITGGVMDELKFKIMTTVQNHLFIYLFPIGDENLEYNLLTYSIKRDIITLCALFFKYTVYILYKL